MTRGKDHRVTQISDTRERPQEANNMFNKILKLLRVDLKMFGDESSDTGSLQAPATSNDTPSSATTEKEPVVIYGKQDSTTMDNGSQQAPDAQGQKTDPEAERKASWSKIKEDYKDLFAAEQENLVKTRFRNQANLEKQIAQLSPYAPIVTMLMEQKGVKDVNALMSAMQDEYYETLADKEGYTVEQIKEREKLKSENKQLRDRVTNVDQEARVNEMVISWNKQAEEIKSEYAEFNLDDWADNKQFMDLLFAGISVKAAYEVCNIEGIKANVAKTMEKNVVSNIQAKGKQIKENGTNPTPGVIFKSSVDQLSRDDIMEIARRARAGEKISF